MSLNLLSEPIFGRLMMVDIQGTSLTAAEAKFLTDNQIAGVCLFARNLASFEQTRQLVAHLHEVMGPSPLIAIDHEGGAVQRAKFLPHAPSAMALAAGGSVETCREVSAAMAHGLHAMGVNWNLGPVVDVNNNPGNPVIAERSFGDRPEQVVKFAKAWMDGHRDQGVATCLKHFPGHGDTTVDSHLALPVVNKSLAQLEGLELKPFHALLTSDAIMTAHVLFTALDQDLPATLSLPILTKLLREQWAYQGVVITDALNMQATDKHYGQALAAQMALSAGADMVMVLGGLDKQAQVLEHLQEAAQQGQLGLEQVLSSIERIKRMAERYPSQLNHSYQSSNDNEVFQLAWQQALTSWGHIRLPVLGSRIRLIAQANVAGSAIAEPGVSAVALAELLGAAFEVELVSVPRLAELDAANLAGETSFTILASNHRGRYPAKVRHKVDLHLAIWNPYAVLDVDAPALITYGFREAALQAVLAYLKGEARALGNLPMQLAVPAQAA